MFPLQQLSRRRVWLWVVQGGGGGVTRTRPMITTPLQKKGQSQQEVVEGAGVRVLDPTTAGSRSRSQQDVMETRRRRGTGSGGGGGGGAVTRPDFSIQNKGIIARILGVPEGEVRKPPKKLIHEESAVAIFQILQETGFMTGEVLRYPDLFMMTPGSTLNYIQIMRESLFTAIGLPQILNFNPLQKQCLEFLRSKKMTPPAPEIVRSYFDVLSMTKKTGVEDSVWNALPLDVSRMTLKELRELVIVRYLAWKLDCDHSEVEGLLPKYSRLSHRSLNWIRGALEVLLTKSTLGSEKILKHGYLLTANPAALSTLLTSLTSLSGIPFHELVSRRPKVLMSSAASLLEIEELFRLHSIPTATLLRHPEIFTLSPSTLRQRLEELSSVPEFIPLKAHPRISRLIYYQKKARQRVEYFRSHNITGASLHLLSMDKTKFKRHVALGEVRNRGKDVITYLKSYLDLEGLTAAKIRVNLQRQPHWLHASVMDVKENVGRLEGLGVDRGQLLDALPLVLYPTERVSQGVDAVLREGSAGLRDSYFLHMVLYRMEKEGHFSGAGIWDNRAASKGVGVGEGGGGDDEQDVEESQRGLERYLENKENKGPSGGGGGGGGGGKRGLEEDEDGDIVFGDSLQETLDGTNRKK